MYFWRKNTFYLAIFIPLQTEIYPAMTFRNILHKLSNRYVIATIVFVLVILFFDQFNLRKQVELHRQLKEQEVEIQHLREGIRLYQDSLRMVTEDPEGMEQIAREKYFMKRDNEVVYKIETQE